jgi:hypothetical protein
MLATSTLATNGPQNVIHLPPANHGSLIRSGMTKQLGSDPNFPQDRINDFYRPAQTPSKSENTYKIHSC